MILLLAGCSGPDRLEGAWTASGDDAGGREVTLTFAKDGTFTASVDGEAVTGTWRRSVLKVDEAEMTMLELRPQPGADGAWPAAFRGQRSSTTQYRLGGGTLVLPQGLAGEGRLKLHPRR